MQYPWVGKMQHEGRSVSSCEVWKNCESCKL